MRHSLNVLAVQVKVWSGPSSARLGTVAPINNINAVNTVECRGIMASDEVDGSENNECTAFSGAVDAKPSTKSLFAYTAYTLRVGAMAEAVKLYQDQP